MPLHSAFYLHTKKLIPASSLPYFDIQKGHLPKIPPVSYYISLKSHIRIG